MMLVDMDQTVENSITQETANTNIIQIIFLSLILWLIWHPFPKIKKHLSKKTMTLDILKKENKISFSTPDKLNLYQVLTAIAHNSYMILFVSMVQIAYTF